MRSANEWALSRAGLKIIDLQLNDINGGSFAVTAAHADSSHVPTPAVAEIVRNEAGFISNRPSPIACLPNASSKHREELIALLRKAQIGGGNRTRLRRFDQRGM